jgi:DNA-binding NtrC family response regulator
VAPKNNKKTKRMKPLCVAHARCPASSPQEVVYAPRMSRNWLEDPTEPLVGGTIVESPRSIAEHRLRLRAVAGPDSGREWDVRASALRIGTAPDNDVRPNDPSVSRHHCEIRVRDGRYALRDLGSTNGTHVAGAVMLEGWLEEGARFRVGQTELEFGGSRAIVSIASGSESFGALHGRAPSMRALFGVLERIAPTRLSAIVLGETGTGKELVARALHEKSKRSEAPFVVVDCGAMSRTLIESDLFGHERGAFTGAERSRPGAFERAQGGTLFLDEIGELPLELQPKLLRALELGEVMRLGGSDVVDVDVRIVAATHRDLGAMVARGEFREDLYYRLAEIVVAIPPLRERREDIADLARALLREWDESSPPLDDVALASLSARDWPGNVRELRNVVRRAAALAGGSRIDRSVLERLDQVARAREAPIEPKRGTVELCAHLGIREARQHWIETLERDYLASMKERFGDDVDAIADHMGILRKSVFRLLRIHGLIAE